MGIQSNINSGISTLSYILSLGKKLENHDDRISDNAVKITDSIMDEQVKVERGKKDIVKKPFDPFDKQIEEFKSKLSKDEIALLDAQESKKPGSTRNLVDNYIRGRMKHEKNSAHFRDRADKLMSNATQEDLADPKFMERINFYERAGTAPYVTQSYFLARAEKQHYYDTAEERANSFSSGIANRPPRMVNERTKEDVATANASDRLKMDVENKMKQETLKEERRNILQNMNTDLNNIPRGDI